MAHSGRIKGSRRTWAAACALLGIAVLIGLGTWQLLRLQEKEALITERQARFAQTPLEALPAGDLEPSAASLDFRPIRLQGRFLGDPEFQLGSQTYEREVGRHIISPFLLDDGRVLLVNRGWVPEGKHDPDNRPKSFAGGEATVIGILRLSPVKKPSSFTPDNDPANNFWHWLDIAAMVHEAKLEQGITVLYLQAAPAGDVEEKTVLPRPLPAKVALRSSHLEYALTWYALALVLAVVAVIFLRQNRNRVAEAPSKKD
jgi:surfeit locus 1 family protein